MRDKLSRRTVAFTARCTEATDFILQGCASVIKGSKGDVLEYLANNFLDPKHDYRYIKLTDQAQRAVNVLAFNNRVTKEEYLDLLLAREIYGPQPLPKPAHLHTEDRGPKETLSLSIESWIIQHLDERAKAANKTRSEYMREFLKYHLSGGSDFKPSPNSRPLSDFANNSTAKIEVYPK